MSRPRKNDPGSDWPHLVSVGIQVGAVLAVLVLAAVLQTGDGLSPQAAAGGDLPPLPAPPGYGDPASTPDPAAWELTQEQVRDSEPAGPGDPQADLQDPLAERATLDVERLAAHGSGWTAQVALLCDPASVDRLLEQHAAGSLYVLPAERADRLCFRMCWGHYASADAARGAADMPASLRAGDFFPVRVSTVLP